MEIKRSELLGKLQNSEVAITNKAILEQSNTCVFSEGCLITFDGEVLTRQISPFQNEIEGSVIAADFIKVLQKFPDETVFVERRENEIVIKGKRRSAGIKMMAEISLPYTDVPVPEKWRKMPDGLVAVLTQATQTCGKDESAPRTTHVHIASDRVEATDSFRVFRADMETGVKKPILIHAVNLASVCKYKPVKMSGGGGWFHFKTEDGLSLSVLCSADTYYDKEMIDKLLNIKGEKVKFPENMTEILERAEIMDISSQSASSWDSQVQITLCDNMLKIKSQKEEGWFRETKKVQYNGPSITFSIHPLFMKELTSKTREAIINNRQIKVEIGNIHFTTSLKIGGKEEEE